MKKLGFLLFFIVLTAHSANVPISALPLGTASGTSSLDSFPYVAASVSVTKILTLWDLINLPPMVSTYAPIANPTFTGTVTAPSFVGTLTGNATNVSGTVLAAHGGTGLTSPGTSGNVLTSNGSSWVSSAPAITANQSANTVYSGPNTGSPAAPTFRALVGADLPNPSSSSLGGIQSAAAVSNNWINSISTSGVPSLSQPAFTNISGSVASTQMPALTGDVTTSAGTVATTIGANKVANSQLAQAPTLTLKGNNTGGTANELDLTVSQVNTMLGTLSNPMTTSGDIIYGGASGLPTRLPKGSNGQILDLTSGIPAWIDPGTSQHAFFSSTGTWTKPASVLSTTIVKITVVGGGGSAGNGAATSGGCGGGGGGGGGAAIRWVAGTSLGSTEAVTINGAGGSSSFGSWASATAGGNGGAGSGVGTPGAGAVGGVGSSGDINLTGIPSNYGTCGIAATVNGVGGLGGSSALGSGGLGGLNSTNGTSGTGYGGGGGGGGGGGASSAGSATGGAVLLEWVG